MTKDELIEKYRDINTDHYDWWENALDEFRDKMEHRGIVFRKDDTEFRLAYSQGDYARFKCVIYDENLDLFLKHHKLYEEYPLFETAKTYDCEAGINVEYIGQVSVEVDIFRTHDFVSYAAMDFDEEDMRYAMLEALDDQWELVMRTSEPGSPSCEEVIQEIFRGYCDDLHYAMRDEYESLSSDKSVWDSIVANGFDKELEEDEDAA